MKTILMTSKNSKTSDPHRLLLNLTDKINLKRRDKYVALSNLRTINLKDQLRRGTMGFIYLMKHILHQRFKIILNIYQKDMDKRL